jgi:hypothetical protein
VVFPLSAILAAAVGQDAHHVSDQVLAITA